ncbi:MAG: hypothetical protein J0I98_18405 [Mesorhizobium sp.]|nr:hypothetical protein [Mesorhizobium sp.]
MNAFSVRSIGRSGCLVAMAAALAVSGTVVAPLAIPTYQAASAAVVSVTVRERLSSYGAWQTSRRFGEVWVPTVAARWRPYTDGRWIWTDDGWYWQSDEPFGVVVYHYGNWVYDDDLGWVWVAGDEWAPAWVVWRESDEDIGWVPAPPPEVHVVVADAWWAFAPVAAIGAVNILRQVRPIEDNVTIVRNTTIINNTTTIVNNYNDHRTVRLGNAVVPVNAGPPLARLPRPVFTALKAAKVVPPAKGRFVAARLDATKGGAVKQMAMRKPAGKPAPVGQAGGGGPLAGNQAHAPRPPAAATSNPGRTVAGNPAPIVKKPAAMATAKPVGTGKAPAAVMARKVPSKGAPSANAHPPRMAKAVPAKPMPNRKVVTARPQSNHMAAMGRPASHPAARRPPANAQFARVNRPRPQRAGMPHRAVAAKRPPAKCGPHDPRCKPRG